MRADGYTEPLKRILEWIELCIEEGNDVKFPEVSQFSSPVADHPPVTIHLPNVSTQIVDESALYLLLEIIILADKLKIPEMSLQAQLRKAAMKYARHSLIDICHVILIYDDSEGNKEYLGGGGTDALREAAAASIFEAWWSRTLDEPEYDEYCSHLEQLRAKFPKLDEDLNKRFDDKMAYINQKREEKREARANGGPRGGRGKENNYGAEATSAADYPEATGADGGWGEATAAVADDHIGEWGASDGPEPAHTAALGEPALAW